MQKLTKTMIYLIALFIIQYNFGCEIISKDNSISKSEVEVVEITNAKTDESLTIANENKENNQLSSIKPVEKVGKEVVEVEIALTNQNRIPKTLKKENKTGISSKIEDVTKETRVEIIKEPTDADNSKNDVPVDFKLEHKIFDELLSNHIDNQGFVNYSELKKKESTLDLYLDQLANNTPTDQWSQDEQLAYWINAYNAFTIKLILKNFPVAHITDLDNGDPWKVKWIKLGEENYSLNNIEHDIIRPDFKEPRIHFAVNCAAKSCPPIQNRAFTAENLDNLLDQATISFVNNKRFNQISVDKAELSKIFEWYAEDFGDLKAFINQYSDIKLGRNASVNYKEYDWSLNGE